MSMRKYLFIISAFCGLLLSDRPGNAAETDSRSKPFFLYSRHYNAPGENRYSPEGSYSELLSRLKKDFDVRVHGQPLNSRTLGAADVVLIANPSDKAAGTNAAPAHITPEDIEALTKFVVNGGGLIVMGNQENHNLETKNVNQLLGYFGMQFTNVYTDAKKLVLPKETPIIGGLRWGYYTGNQVLIKQRHAAKPRALIVNDLAQKPIGGDRDATGILLAVAEPGNGRVVVVTDSGWLSNDALDDNGIGPAVVKGQDNFEIFRRLALWAAEHRTDRTAAQ
jgi:hypothetical protein